MKETSKIALTALAAFGAGEFYQKNISNDKLRIALLEQSRFDMKVSLFLTIGELPEEIQDKYHQVEDIAKSEQLDLFWFQEELMNSAIKGKLKQRIEDDYSMGKERFLNNVHKKVKDFHERAKLKL